MTTYYTDDHEWVEVDGDTATVGITKYAAEQLGEVVFIELKDAGERSGADVQVTGHTDTLGSGADNDALSLRRAQSIRELLIDRGLKPELVRAAGRGERELLEQTGDGVRNAKNRRVEVTVR